MKSVDLESKLLRTFKKNTREYELYRDMHENQCLKFAREKRDYYGKLNKRVMSIKKALSLMDYFIDPSDPDLDVANSIHAYQTAERIRKLYPDNKELQIVGLIHDLGKVLFIFNEPSWAVVGDTYIVGCEFPKSIVYYDSLKSSPDAHKYHEAGIYEKGCGLDNVIISFGHDEYLYQVLKGNMERHNISKKYIDIIRFHSLYPWHTGGAYRDLMNEKDYETLNNVLEFNKFDLYSKEDSVEIDDSVKEYYSKLLDEFFGEELYW